MERRRYRPTGYGAWTHRSLPQRVLQDVPVEEVVDEYAFAVDVVRNWLVERGTEVPPEEFSFFHSAIFGFVAESVRRYTKVKEQRVAREKALFVRVSRIRCALPCRRWL